MKESALQSQVVAYLALREARGDLWFAAVPNGLFIHGRTMQERAKRMGIMKRLGMVRPGAPDLVMVLKGGAFAAIELKVGRGKTSDTQEAFRATILKLGGRYAVCRSIAEVIGTIDAWMIGRNT